MLLPFPVAQHLLAGYCRAREPQLLKTICYYANRPADAATLAIDEAYRAKTWAQRLRGLAIALRVCLGASYCFAFIPYLHRRLLPYVSPQR